MKHTPRKLFFFLALVIFGFSGCSQTVDKFRFLVEDLEQLYYAIRTQGDAEAQDTLGTCTTRARGFLRTTYRLTCGRTWHLPTQLEKQEKRPLKIETLYV